MFAVSEREARRNIDEKAQQCSIKYYSAEYYSAEYYSAEYCSHAQNIMNSGQEMDVWEVLRMVRFQPPPRKVPGN